MTLPDVAHDAAAARQQRALPRHCPRLPVIVTPRRCNERSRLDTARTTRLADA